MGFVGSEGRAGDPSCLELRARRQEPPSVHGCGWDSGAARERSSALWLPASPRVTRLAPMAWALRARAPVAAGSLPRATRSAPKAGARRARAPTCAPHVLRTLSPGGEWGCRRRRALRAAREARCKACFELLRRARVGWHTARTLLPPPPPHSSGAPVRWLMARGRRASGVAAAPRSRAVGAPAAGEDLVVVVVVRTPTPNYLRQASPDRGKY